MKKVLLIWWLFGGVLSLQAQDIVGVWNTTLNIQGISMRLVFHIEKTDLLYSGTMDSPDQGAIGLALGKVEFENDTLSIEISALQIRYEGRLNATRDSVIGLFKQGSFSISLNLSKSKLTETNVSLKRPQEPKPPFPYRSEEVVIENKVGGLKLAGTLTLPEKIGKYPAVVLISGSGPQDRDEALMGHKPFAVIADFLSRNGIAVLRYDDRGVGKSTGTFSGATSADLATDAEAAFNYLLSHKEIDVKKVGLLGHSEGGLIAPMIAVRNSKLAFVVLLAGPAVKGSEVLLEQQELIISAMSGVSQEEMDLSKILNSEVFSLIEKTKDSAELRQKINVYLEQAIENLPEEIKVQLADSNGIPMMQKAIGSILDPWMLYFLRYDPAPNLKKLKCPTLALFGDKDLQVSASQNMPKMLLYFKESGNTKAMVKSYPDLNHLFQHADKGIPSEYAKIEETISPEVLQDILDFIRKY